MDEFITQDLRNKMEMHLAISHSIKKLIEISLQPHVANDPKLKAIIESTLLRGYNALNSSYSELTAILEIITDKPNAQKRGF